MLIMSAVYQYTWCVQVELLAEHVKQLGLCHGDGSVRERAALSLESAAVSHPLTVRDSILPSLLQMFTLDTCMYMYVCVPRAI